MKLKKVLHVYNCNVSEEIKNIVYHNKNIRGVKSPRLRGNPRFEKNQNSSFPRFSLKCRRKSAFLSKKIDSRIFLFKGFLVLSDVNVQSLQQIQNVLRYENRGYGNSWRNLCRDYRVKCRLHAPCFFSHVSGRQFVTWWPITVKINRKITLHKLRKVTESCIMASGIAIHKSIIVERGGQYDTNADKTDPNINNPWKYGDEWYAVVCFVHSLIVPWEIQLT